MNCVMIKNQLPRAAPYMRIYGETYRDDDYGLPFGCNCATGLGCGLMRAKWRLDYLHNHTRRTKNLLARNKMVSHRLRVGIQPAANVWEMSAAKGFVSGVACDE